MKLLRHARKAKHFRKVKHLRFLVPILTPVAVTLATAAVRYVKPSRDKTATQPKREVVTGRKLWVFEAPNRAALQKVATELDLTIRHYADPEEYKLASRNLRQLPEKPAILAISRLHGRPNHFEISVSWVGDEPKGLKELQAQISKAVAV